MNEKVKEFLDAKKDAENKKYEEAKNKTLVELGLFEKVYSESSDQSKEFPYYEYDSENSKNRWYKKEAIAISDEEYEEVKKYSKTQNTEVERNPISTMLRVIAIIVYVAGLIAGFVLGLDRWGDPTAMMLVYWIAFFVLGTVYLGFAEIIQLLNDIKNK